MNDRIDEVPYRMFRQLRSLGLYIALAVVLPGGLVLALLLWVHQRMKSKPLT